VKVRPGYVIRNFCVGVPLRPDEREIIETEAGRRKMTNAALMRVCALAYLRGCKIEEIK
jgi:hypothetical protein